MPRASKVKEAPGMVTLFQDSGYRGTEWAADFSSPTLPIPGPPKDWSLEAGSFFPPSNWKNWPTSLARGWEGEQGGIEPGGTSQWSLCPGQPGAGPVSDGDNSQKAVTLAGPGIPGGIFQSLKAYCLSSHGDPGSLLPCLPPPHPRWAPCPEAQAPSPTLRCHCD